MSSPIDRLDARTAISLGEALFNFLAGTNEEAELDEFNWEDTGVAISSGFIQMPYEVADAVKETLFDAQEG